MATEFIRSKFSSLREYLTPLNHESNFAETGEISPEEFVKAGDYLVYKFPTWRWSPTSSSKRRDFLPDDKQFLVTRHVPSYVRATDYEKEETSDNGEDYIDPLSPEEGWTSTHTEVLHKHCTPDDERRHSAEYVKMKGPYESAQSSVNNKARSSISSSSPDIPSLLGVESGDSRADANNNEIDSVNDIDELIDDDAEETLEEDRKNQENLDGEIINDPHKRSYDLYITYSTSYRVPKMYLVGFDSNGVPLSPQQMFEDIASDYRHKTVTIEKAPFLENTTAVSIHPCRHSTVMKALMKMTIAAAQKKVKGTHSLEAQTEDEIVKNLSKLGLADKDENSGNEVPITDPKDEWQDLHQDDENDNDDINPDGNIRVDQYLVIFLKFMASVTPGIEHDYTMDAL